MNNRVSNNDSTNPDNLVTRIENDGFEQMNEINLNSDKEDTSLKSNRAKTIEPLRTKLSKSQTLTEFEKRKKKIFDDNEIGDLKRFLSRRKCLNRCNISMAYVFHAFQVGGIFTTSIATGLGMPNFVWLGVGLNSLASLISMFEKTNDGIMKRMLNNIKKIKENRYVDESNVVDLEQGTNSIPASPPQK
jgi:hypothetical protein